LLAVNILISGIENSALHSLFANGECRSSGQVIAPNLHVNT
jgi:hypothetical protein